jgi:uncharacterized protein YprB with RNaseH-like and TPR domain
MKQESKHKSGEQEQLAAKSSQQFTATEYATAEELLRHDAAQTDVPPVIAERLSQSIQNLPRPSRSWWQRMFNR